MEAHYHMRRSDREITDRNEIDGILKNGTYASVALCRGDEPYVVSLSYGYDKAANRLYFHCAGSGRKLEVLAENPRACASVVEDGGYVRGQCEHRYRSVVLSGKMAVVTDLEEKKHGFEVLLNHLERDPAPVKARTLPDAAAYGAVTVLRLDIESAAGKQGR